MGRPSRAMKTDRSGLIHLHRLGLEREAILSGSIAGMEFAHRLIFAFDPGLCCTAC